MKSPVSGLSLIIHLAIIFCAMLLGFIFGRENWEALRRTWTANGSSPAHTYILQIISIVIILFLGAFMLFATSVAIQTGIREGAREPQVIFAKTVITALGAKTEAAFALMVNEVVSRGISDFAVRTVIFDRAGNQ